MNKKLKKISAMILSVATIMSLSAVSMPVFAETESVNSIIDLDEYMKNLSEQQYQDSYGDLCDGELFYTCKGTEVSIVDENGKPVENLEVKFIERVDGGNDKYKVIESWNTSDEPVKKIFVEDMMPDDNNKYYHTYSVIIDNIPDGYVCEFMEDLKETMALPKDEQPTGWVYCSIGRMSVKQTKFDNDTAKWFGEDVYYEKVKIEVISESAYKQREEEYQKYLDSLEPSIPELAEIVTDVVNEIKPTLSGDADCDSKVNINDAVFVMQSIANPDKYQLSWQGKANADIDGNGITLSDAVTIQEMAASHLYD